MLWSSLVGRCFPDDTDRPSARLGPGVLWQAPPFWAGLLCQLPQGGLCPEHGEGKGCVASAASGLLPVGLWVVDCLACMWPFCGRSWRVRNTGSQATRRATVSV